ncbi:hypothetical protein HPB50_017520 [Hyalomma asiaticum]|uniref:Uncharacterized protein n=1 Tax=Hyalomma asiaticum TaxID=266040 RepID=A0ACB7T5H6_HYAAI|nr:hypothetical protein HPB50_017520 [Hyalomma asiaticum]
MLWVQRMPAENGNGSYMPSAGAAPGQKRLNTDDTSGSPESKHQQTDVPDDESTVIGDDNVADMEDVDEDDFVVVNDRKGLTVGVPVLITATEQGRHHRQVNPLTSHSGMEGMLGASPIRSRFTVIDYVDVPPRCFKCQRFGQVAERCTAEQLCKLSVAANTKEVTAGAPPDLQLWREDSLQGAESHGDLSSV